MVRDQAIKKGVAVDFPAVVGGVPACKDFLQGRCDRGSRCRFRHLSPRDYDIEMNTIPNRPGGGPLSLLGGGGGVNFFADDNDMWRGGSMDRKRRHLEPNGVMEMGGGGVTPPQAFMMLQVGTFHQC